MCQVIIHGISPALIYFHLRFNRVERESEKSVLALCASPPPHPAGNLDFWLVERKRVRRVVCRCRLTKRKYDFPGRYSHCQVFSWKTFAFPESQYALETHIYPKSGGFQNSILNSAGCQYICHRARFRRFKIVRRMCLSGLTVYV
jgi:hypothetical protein